METFFFIIMLVFSLLVYLLYLFRRERTHVIIPLPHVSEAMEEDPHDLSDQDKELKTEVFPLQTHQIKYCVYSKYCFKSPSIQSIYEQIIFANLWFNEPFYSSFFRIVLLLDQNELFIVDPESRVITSKLRTKREKIVSIKSYQIIRIQQLACFMLHELYHDIVRFNQKDAQNLTIAICIHIIQKAKIFEFWKQEHLMELLLESYNDVESVQEILLLIDSRDKQLLFVDCSLKNAMKNIHREPYVDKGGQYNIQIPSKLPQKQLLHI